MRAHRSDDSVTRVVARILRADLVVIDDIGLLPVGTDAAEGLYRLVDAAYEKRSIAISSNLHPAGFDELMPKTLATATVDRLLHHAHVCQTSGDSDPPDPSPRRERSHHDELNDNHPMANATKTLVGRSVGHDRAHIRGHQRAIPLAAHGQKQMAIDTVPRCRSTVEYGVLCTAPRQTCKLSSRSRASGSTVVTSVGRDG